MSLCSSNRQWSIVTGRVSLPPNGDHRGDDDIEVCGIKILNKNTADNTDTHTSYVLYVHQHSHSRRCSETC